MADAIPDRYASLVAQGRISEREACMASTLETGLGLAIDPAQTRGTKHDVQFFSNMEGALSPVLTMERGQGRNIYLYSGDALRFLGESGRTTDFQHTVKGAPLSLSGDDPTLPNLTIKGRNTNGQIVVDPQRTAFARKLMDEHASAHRLFGAATFACGENPAYAARTVERHFRQAPDAQIEPPPQQQPKDVFGVFKSLFGL